MAQKYKVYFANRPVYFVDRQTQPEDVRCRVMNSQGKSDTMLIESAIAAGAREITICSDDVEKAWRSFCGQFEHVAAAGGVVLNDRNELLFIFRHGKWDLPKGKIEESEDSAAGAVREVEEECAIPGPEIIAPLLTTWHTYIQNGEPMLKSTDWYLMRYDGSAVPKPQLEEGITEVRWFKQDKIGEVLSNTYPSVGDVIRAYEEFGPLGKTSD